MGTAPATRGPLALADRPDPVALRPDADAIPADEVVPARPPGSSLGEVVSTGFPALDAILGPPGLVREIGAAFRGGPSSGKTTLAMRCVASSQAQGAIVAWLDLARAFDPLEAIGRGVDLRWLLVVRPADLDEGFSLAASLLSGRSVDLLVVDLPARLPARVDDRLRRLMAHGRRVGARLIVLEPTTIARASAAELTESVGLRLELERRTWLRLGREVVGQRTEVTVARNRHGPPGRSAWIDIHYLAEGERSVAAQLHAAAEASTEGPPLLTTEAHGARRSPGIEHPRLAVA